MLSDTKERQHPQKENKNFRSTDFDLALLWNSFCDPIFLYLSQPHVQASLKDTNKVNQQLSIIMQSQQHI